MRRDSGQSLVEWALIIPLIMLVIFGIIEFGRLYNAHLIVTSSAREGARKAAVSSSEDAVRTAVENAAASLNPATVEKTDAAFIKDTNNIPGTGVMWYAIDYKSGGSRRFGDPVEVCVKARIEIITPIISNIIGTPRPVFAVAVMRVET